MATRKGSSGVPAPRPCAASSAVHRETSDSIRDASLTVSSSSGIVMSAAQPSSATIRKLAPVLLVDAVEPCLPFWTELLGFAVTAQVPEGERIGFAILEKDGVEIMYQSRTSAAADVPALAAVPAGTACLFIEVSDVEAVARALDGTEIVVP